MKKEYFINSKNVLANVYIFNLRFINKIKNTSTDKTFKKFCLIVQAYNNLNKNLVLTQSSIIQQISQRLIICFTAIFQNNITKLYLQNIT